MQVQVWSLVGLVIAREDVWIPVAVVKAVFVTLYPVMAAEGISLDQAIVLQGAINLGWFSFWNS